MGTTTKAARAISMLALAAAGTLAHAGTDDRSPVWIANESFGFETCAAAGAQEDAAATLEALRNSAAAEIAQVAQHAGLSLRGAQVMTFTPVGGRFACGASTSSVVFRVAAVDRDSGRFWSTDLTVRSGAPAPDAVSIASLGGDLARALRAVYAVAPTR